ncbi:hypothetical protein [Gorillibacterium sp. sgz5001074]|uniref:hypothetical protein n=1 Tax=Gorillibacterium sp. sgz5001074 TaxID=3446695 RepID=UPI003F66D8EA
MRGTNRRIIMMFTLLAAVVSAAGCGEKLAEKAVSKAIEEATGAKVEQKDDSVTITTKDGQVQLGGESGKLPEGFPLPAVAGSKITSSAVTTDKGTKHYIVSLSSEKPAKELTAYYEETLKKSGMAVEKTDISDENSTTVIMNGKSDKADAGVQIIDGASIGEKGFVINLFYNQKE